MQDLAKMEPPTPKKSRIKAIALLEIGLFEVGFVLLLLFIIFGGLVFFNVIHLDNPLIARFIPSFIIRTSHVTSQAPTDPFYVQEGNAFLKETLSTKYLPLDMKYYKNPSKTVDYYISPWDQASLSGKLILKYSPGSQEPSKIVFSGFTTKPKNMSKLNVDMIEKLAKIYLAIPQKIVWYCNLTSETPNDSSMCYGSYRDKGETRGYEFIVQNNSDNLAIYACKSFKVVEAGTATSCRKI